MRGSGYVAWPPVKRLTLILVLTMTTAFAATAASAGAQDENYSDPFSWKKCSTKVDFNLKITAARHMRCRGGKRVMGRYHGSIKRKFDAPSGFKCKRVKGKPKNGVWRCSTKSKAFKFKFSD
jgi:hypothetical protein